jgi:hypothetical protein
MAPVDSTGSAEKPEGDRPSAAPPPAFCVPFVTEQLELAAKWPQSTYVPPVLGKCYPTQSGAWAIAFDSVSVNPNAPGVTARFAVVHLSPTGSGVARITAPFEPSPIAGNPAAPVTPSSRSYVLEVGTYYTDVFAPTLFDYDGDGDAELIFTMQAYVSEGGAAGATGRVLTFKHGAIQPYSPSPNLRWSNVEDIDKDNRPDLVGRYLDVAVAAHSLPDGSFSITDSIAQAFAKRACPPGRDAVFLPVVDDAASPTGYGPTGWNGACALLWGATPARVLHEIDKHCGAGVKLPCVRKSTLTDVVNESAASYRRDARVPPPFVFEQTHP